MFVRPDKTGVPFHAVAMRPKRRRGQKLSEAQVRRMSDLVYALLLDTYGLSPTDADRVLARRLRKSQRVDRTRLVGDAVDRHGVFKVMAEVMKDAG